MSTPPPVWLLDLDGVLNAISAKPPRSMWPADQWHRFDAIDSATAGAGRC